MASGCLGVWVVVSQCRSQVGFFWDSWFPSEADLSLYNLARSAAVCPVAEFALFSYGRRNIFGAVPGEERIDGGLAILAILILDLQRQGTDWGISPVLQGY